MFTDAVHTPIFVEECRVLWNHLLEQGIAVAAFVDNPDGGKPIMAGVNMLSMEYKETDEKTKDVNVCYVNFLVIISVKLSIGLTRFNQRPFDD